MKIMLSSAKILGPTTIPGIDPPFFLSEAEKHHKQIQNWKATKIANFYSISPALSAKVREMHQAWDGTLHAAGAPCALGQFNGEVFAKLDVDHLPPAAQAAALGRIVIGSGLYGLLRADDTMQPYRLDMDQKLGKTRLRTYWKPRISAWLREILDGEPCINLASAEYAEAINPIGIHWVDVEFWQESAGKRKAISIFSKQARGLMARHLCLHADMGVGALGTFDAEGYRLDTILSQPTRWVYVR